MDRVQHTTGLKGLDRILKSIHSGDNIVWQVDTIEDYQAFVTPYVEKAVRDGRTLIYFRFADHEPLVAPSPEVRTVEVDRDGGFEVFTGAIHGAIKEGGRGAYYVFDCLSDLAVTWSSDQMLGNFFMLTCPYLYDLETITFFALFRGQHSQFALGPITHTTQLFLDVYRHEGSLYVRPMKVQHRYSDTMNMLHEWRDGNFKPVTASTLIASILTSARWSGLISDRGPGFWDRAFLDAVKVHTEVMAGDRPPEDERPYFESLVGMVISRDELMRPLIHRYLRLKDILDVHRRMLGTGLIGGKSVGMLLARAILKRSASRFEDILEPHDSFFIGSDVFYTYLVENGIWWLRQHQRNSDDFYESATRARRLILTGKFPERTMEQFEEMLDYFGQSPFIVRSSSLLEDNFGNAFAGKYDSVFCANQGPRAQRLEDLVAAVRTIYASAMSERALRYRAHRGMLDHDEQMALLVMRVSGRAYGKKFYPPVAGVGFSYNPYVWDESIDAKAGVVRLVFGLGTRAVERSDDDYTRLVALNAPERRPEHSFDEVQQYAQRRVDYIDLEANQLVSSHFLDIVDDTGEMPLHLFTSADRSTRDRTGKRVPVLTFDGLVSKTDFVQDARAMLDALQRAYDYAVDIEFTANFDEEGDYMINLVQCRPLQAKGTETVDLPEVTFRDEDRVIEARSAVIGQSRVVSVDYLIYVEPPAYGALPVRQRYEVADLLGRINRAIPETGEQTIMLLGPGRWGTSSPSLGIPVNFMNINRVNILCEIVAMRKDLVPDVSLGTHFLNELVEMDMLYLALFPEQGDDCLRSEAFRTVRNRLVELVSDAGKWEDTVRVVRATDLCPGGEVEVIADSVEQRVVCYLKRPGNETP
jgi:pyruvate, water dikinase